MAVSYTHLDVYKRQGRRCGQAETTTAGGNVVVTLPLSEVHLWEAGAGRLYDLTITFGEDTVHSYFGLRNITISGEKVLINGKSVFQRLVLDLSLIHISLEWVS